MFDEKNNVWIKIAKVITIIVFASLIIIGIWQLIDKRLWSDFVDRILLPCSWFVIAFLQLSISMLSLNLVSNVQTTREKLEETNNK